MATVEALSSRIYTKGRATFGPMDVPDAATRAVVRAFRGEVNGGGTSIRPSSRWVDIKDAQEVPQEVANVATELSLDGGATWQTWIGFGAMGGVVMTSGGTEAKFSAVSASLPAGTGRKLRGRIDCADDITTKVEVEWL